VPKQACDVGNTATLGGTMKVGDLVKFADGNPKSEALGLVLPSVEGMSRHWTNTEDSDMVNVLWTHIGVSPYRKDYLKVVK
jgi:hypothetical protein